MTKVLQQRQTGHRSLIRTLMAASAADQELRDHHPQQKLGPETALDDDHGSPISVIGHGHSSAISLSHHSSASASMEHPICTTGGGAGEGELQQHCNGGSASKDDQRSTADSAGEGQKISYVQEEMDGKACAYAFDPYELIAKLNDARSEQIGGRFNQDNSSLMLHDDPVNDEDNELAEPFYKELFSDTESANLASSTDRFSIACKEEDAEDSLIDFFPCYTDDTGLHDDGENGGGASMLQNMDSREQYAKLADAFRKGLLRNLNHTSQTLDHHNSGDQGVLGANEVGCKSVSNYLISPALAPSKWRHAEKWLVKTDPANTAKIKSRNNWPRSSSSSGSRISDGELNITTNNRAHELGDCDDSCRSRSRNFSQELPKQAYRAKIRRNFSHELSRPWPCQSLLSPNPSITTDQQQLIDTAMGNGPATICHENHHTNAVPSCQEDVWQAINRKLEPFSSNTSSSSKTQQSLNKKSSPLRIKDPSSAPAIFTNYNTSRTSSDYQRLVVKHETDAELHDKRQTILLPQDKPMSTGHEISEDRTTVNQAKERASLVKLRELTEASTETNSCDVIMPLGNTNCIKDHKNADTITTAAYNCRPPVLSNPSILDDDGDNNYVGSIINDAKQRRAFSTGRLRDVGTQVTPLCSARASPVISSKYMNTNLNMLTNSKNMSTNPMLIKQEQGADVAANPNKISVANQVGIIIADDQLPKQAYPATSPPRHNTPTRPNPILDEATNRSSDQVPASINYKRCAGGGCNNTMTINPVELQSCHLAKLELEDSLDVIPADDEQCNNGSTVISTSNHKNSTKPRLTGDHVNNMNHHQCAAEAAPSASTSNLISHYHPWWPGMRDWLADHDQYMQDNDHFYATTDAGPAAATTESESCAFLLDHHHQFPSACTASHARRPHHRSGHGQQHASSSSNSATKFNLLEARASAWEHAERAKYTARHKREEAKIEAWENLQRAKAEAELRKLEAKLERLRCEAVEKIMGKLAGAQRRAQEMRASAEAHRADHLARVAERANFIRHNGGHFPASLTVCFTRIP